jgi:uncharacterized protein YjiS (DUF1127 family)
MLFAAAIARLREALRRRSAHRRLVAEIAELSDQEIHDLGGDRAEMLRHTRQIVYGAAR